jgi:hypothetical protein
MLGLAVALGCRHGSVPAAVPSPAPIVVPDPLPVSPWPAILATALRSAESGRYDEAEKMLLEFSVRNAGTGDGAESDFWRAMLRLDPANRASNPRQALPLLDSYLSGSPSLPRHTEVQILRRLAEAIDSSRTAVDALRSSLDARQKARDDEIKQLNDDLNKTMAELERIKRRLVPKPPTPTQP